MTDNPYALGFGPRDWDALITYLRASPATIFHDKSIRAAVIKRRQEMFGVEKVFEGELPHSITLTVPYNLNHARGGLESHVARLVKPLSCLDPFYETAATTKVLSIGGRTEGEILTLIANGFAPENITAIDVVSVSPLIQIMDMHAMTFAADTFDLCVCGWTAPYSRDFSIAIAEMVRVTKSGGVIAVGLTREPPGCEDHARLNAQGSTVYESTTDIVMDFPNDVIVKPLFIANPEDKSRKGALLLIVRIFKTTA